MKELPLRRVVQQALSQAVLLNPAFRFFRLEIAPRPLAPLDAMRQRGPDSRGAARIGDRLCHVAGCSSRISVAPGVAWALQ